MAIVYIVSVPRNKAKPDHRHDYITKDGRRTQNILKAEEHVDRWGAEQVAVKHELAEITQAEPNRNLI